MTNHHHSYYSESDDRHAGYGWLAVCVVGMLTSLTVYGIVLEYITSGGRELHEWSFLLISTSIYSVVAYIARSALGEKQTEISKSNILILSITSVASNFTSVRSLRYVIYPVQVLFKSCKPVLVMAFNVILGKRYKLVKYIHVMLIIIGVGVFLAAGDSMQSSSVNSNTTLLGAIMLSVSLCFDGATGAYEDRLMNRHNVEPFDLMYNIQLGKAVISLTMLIVGNNYSELVGTIANGGFSLLVLGITGAIGQVFVFITISKFGALNCALIGLCRKMLSLILSFLLYGHSINAIQTVGLSLAIIAMIANFYEKGEIKFKENSEQLDLEDLNDEKMPEKVCLLRISATTEDGTDSVISPASGGGMSYKKKESLSDITSGARGGDDGKGLPEGKIAFSGMHRL